MSRLPRHRRNGALRNDWLPVLVTPHRFGVLNRRYGSVGRIIKKDGALGLLMLTRQRDFSRNLWRAVR